MHAKSIATAAFQAGDAQMQPRLPSLCRPSYESQLMNLAVKAQHSPVSNGWLPRV